MLILNQIPSGQNRHFRGFHCWPEDFHSMFSIILVSNITWDQYNTFPSILHYCVCLTLQHVLNQEQSCHKILMEKVQKSCLYITCQLSTWWYLWRHHSKLVRVIPLQKKQETGRLIMTLVPRKTKSQLSDFSNLISALNHPLYYVLNSNGCLHN